MDGEEKITALFDRDFIHHPCFNHLSTDEKNIISQRLRQNESIAVGVYCHDRFLFAAIFDFEGDTLHTREVAGNFGRNWRHLWNIGAFIGKGLLMTYITLNTKRRAVERFAKRAGFERSENGEFVKVIM